MCEKAFRKYDLEFGKFVKSGDIERVAKEAFSLQGADNLLVNIGYGRISASQLLSKVVPPSRLALKNGFGLKSVLERFKTAKPRPSEGVIVKGIEDVMVRFAKCCNPLPGDKIVGYITQGQGMAIHVRGCPNILYVDEDRKIDVGWDEGAAIARPVRIEVICKNEKGLLADITNAIKNADANITQADIKTTPDNKAVCSFEVEVKNVQHLKNIIGAIEKIKKVIKVERVMNEKAAEGGKKAGRHPG